MASPEDNLREKLGRKLAKRKMAPRRVSMDIPERFKDGEDAQDDVTAPKDPAGRHMYQSVFSMITAAGSQADFQSRFDEASSDSEGGEGSGDDKPRPSSETTDTTVEESQGSKSSEVRAVKHRKILSHNKLVKSLPKLRLKSIREKKDHPRSESMSSSQILPPKPSEDEVAEEAPRPDAPVMTRMLKAEAELEASDYGSSTQVPKDEALVGTSRVRAPVSLAQRLMEIFEFDSPEEVISEYPCWLMQSVLLQGYMYITQKHICFYAYLPKKSNVVVKSGYLSKRGRQNPKYHRYWFKLAGDVLTYYTNPSQPYFQSGNIDLRYGISATLSEQKDKSKDATAFSVTTDQRTYHFKADSAASAKEWVKSLQKVIFRSHNDGDSVKISLPIANVMDVEESPMLDFADTVKIRVIDNDETYAIDEYFFSFFSFGQDALSVLRIMINDNGLQGADNDARATDVTEGPDPQQDQKGRQSLSLEHPSVTSGEAPTPPLRESVRATLSPVLPTGRGTSNSGLSADSARSSFDAHRRSLDVTSGSRRVSFERGRRSLSARRSESGSRDRRVDKSPLSPRPRDSSDSVDNSLDPDTESSAVIQSIDDSNVSASQILNRSDVFRTPTIHPPQRAASESSVDPLRRSSQETARSLKTRPKAPSRLQSGQSHQLRQADAKVPTSNEAEEDQETHQAKMLSGSSSALQGLMNAGAYPLQRASGIAGFLRKRSQRMSNLLATESMGYYEKVSGMWAGGRKHYGTAEALAPDDEIQDPEDEEDAATHGGRFRAHFALPDSEELLATYFAYLHRVLPLYGKIYVSNRHFCFRSLLPGTRTKLVLPLKDIENVVKEKGFRLRYSGLVISIRGFEELFFEFSQSEARDDCTITILQSLESVKYMQGSGTLNGDEKLEAEAAKAEHQLLQQARQDSHAEHEISMPKDVSKIEPDAPPILFDDPRASILNFKPTESLRITCLTIGSRGDVQPYIALCKGLLAEGHKPRIATHAEFEPWVRQYGIDFATVDGDPAELMRICVENGMFTYSFLKEATTKFRGWIDELLSSAWKACQNSDLLIESPSAMAGIHIAEALQIPYFRAFGMPWTRTRAYPHAFAVPEHKMGGAYNYMSYVMFDAVFWKAIAGQVNRWRKKELGLGSTSLDKMQPNKVPFLYNFSPSVVAPPLDYSDWIRVTGYWFLNEGDNWTPPEELSNFIQKARADGKKLVYVGFGSIVVEDPAALTKTVVDSVLRADVRCILSKGWSDRLGKKDASAPEIPLPPEILQIKSAPHDWLFMQVDAAAHHGGAGTTGASLKAGIPTIIKPFFGDQFFWGSRVEDLRVGISLKKMNTSLFSRALWEATHSERMLVKARVLGEQIRKEDGVGNAIQAIYRDMEYAKSLIKRRDRQTDDPADDFEESWTFIGDDSDPELTRRIAEWDPTTRMGQAGNGRSSLTALGSVIRKGSVPGQGHVGSS